jgi:hypothetical protein
MEEESDIAQQHPVSPTSKQVSASAVQIALIGMVMRVPRHLTANDANELLARGLRSSLGTSTGSQTSSTIQPA